MGEYGFGIKNCSYPESSQGTMVGDTEMTSVLSPSEMFRQIRVLQLNILEGITEAMKIMVKDMSSCACDGPSPPQHAARTTKKSVSADDDVLHVDNTRLHYFVTCRDPAVVAGAIRLPESSLAFRAYTRFNQDQFRDFFCEVPFVQANNKWGLIIENDVTVFSIPGAEAYDLNIVAKCAVVYKPEDGRA